MEERGDEEERVVAGDAEPIDEVLPVDARTAMRGEHALRVPRRARGVEKKRGVARPGRDPGGGLLGTFEQRFEGERVGDRAEGGDPGGGHGVPQRTHCSGASGVRHDDARLGVTDDVAELARTERRVHRMDDSADLERAEGGRNPMQRVAKRERHPIPGLDAEPAEDVRRAVRQAVELTVREPGAGVKNEALVATRREVTGEDVEQGHAGPLISRARGACQRTARGDAR